MKCITVGENSIDAVSAKVQSVVPRPVHLSYQHQDAYDPLQYPSSTQAQSAVTRSGRFQYQHQNVRFSNTMFQSSSSKIQRLSESPNRLRIAQDLEGTRYIDNECIASTCRSPEQSDMRLVHKNIKSSEGQKQTFKYDGSTQQNNVIQLPPAVDETKFAKEVGHKSSERENQKSRSTLKSSEYCKKKQGWVVKSISEWIFPPGTKNKHSFVVSSLRQGIGPKISCNHHSEPEIKSTRSLSMLRTKDRFLVNKKRKPQEKHFETTPIHEDSRKMIHPIVTGAEFDNRFLEYELSPGGRKKKDILVRTLSMMTIPFENRSQAKEALENKHIEEIPDDPSRAKTSSRIGPKFQARIPLKLLDSSKADKFEISLPGYDILWDPKLAEEAEQRGEDLSEFLEGKHELCKQELLISILHKNGYCVEAARIDFERMQSLDNSSSSSKLNKSEERHFCALIRESQKDFSSIAKNLKRKRSDCLVYYYGWKSSNRVYQSMKKKWNDRYCSVCDDGGDLIICDGCNSNFHMECAKPPLSVVPEGKWFCHSCRYTKRAVISPLSSIVSGKNRSSSESVTGSDIYESEPQNISNKNTSKVLF